MQPKTSLWHLIGMLLVIFLAACNAPANEKPTQDIIQTATQESQTIIADQNWVIFSAEQAEEMRLASWLPFGSGYEGFWSPSEADILKLEGGITQYLQQNSDLFYRQPPVWERLNEYRRQYFGLEQEGKRVIYGNYYCRSTGVDDRQDFVSVDDGGDCYFQLKYDIESEDFIELRVNGES